MRDVIIKNSAPPLFDIFYDPPHAHLCLERKICIFNPISRAQRDFQYLFGSGQGSYRSSKNQVGTLRDFTEHFKGSHRGPDGPDPPVGLTGAIVVVICPA